MSKVYGIEIVGKEAYTELINRSETAYGKQRNDFEGTFDDCIAYLRKENISIVYGVLSDDKKVIKCS